MLSVIMLNVTYKPFMLSVVCRWLKKGKLIYAPFYSAPLVKARIPRHRSTFIRDGALFKDYFPPVTFPLRHFWVPRHLIYLPFCSKRSIYFKWDVGKWSQVKIMLKNIQVFISGSNNNKLTKRPSTIFYLLVPKCIIKDLVTQ